jgi:hypothetical protein
MIFETAISLLNTNNVETMIPYMEKAETTKRTPFQVNSLQNNKAATQPIANEIAIQTTGTMAQ